MQRPPFLAACWAVETPDPAVRVSARGEGRGHLPHGLASPGTPRSGGPIAPHLPSRIVTITTDLSTANPHCQFDTSQRGSTIARGVRNEETGVIA